MAQLAVDPSAEQYLSIPLAGTYQCYWHKMQGNVAEYLLLPIAVYRDARLMPAQALKKTLQHERKSHLVV